MAYPIASMADGGVKYSDGSVQYNTSNPPVSSVKNVSGGGQEVSYAGGGGRSQNAPTQGDVLGASTSNVSSGGGGSSSQNNNPNAGGGNPYDNLANKVKDSGPSQAEIDSAFNPIFDVLNKAEYNLRGQKPGLISEAQQQAEASRQLLSNQRQTANDQLGTQTRDTNQARQSAVARQRQILQELSQANQGRFGGATSAGRAASELQGREFQRGVAGIDQNAQNAIQQIALQKNQVERDYQQGLKQLEVNRQKAVNDINRKFQDRLLEIDKQRGETESAKASARLNAVQELRNAVFQINTQKAQFEADLQLQAQQNHQYLDDTASQIQNYLATSQSSVDQLSNYSPNAIPAVQSSNQQDTSQYIGQISKDKKDKLAQLNPGAQIVSALPDNTKVTSFSLANTAGL